MGAPLCTACSTTNHAMHMPPRGHACWLSQSLQVLRDTFLPAHRWCPLPPPRCRTCLKTAGGGGLAARKRTNSQGRDFWKRRDLLKVTQGLFLSRGRLGASNSKIGCPPGWACGIFLELEAPLRRGAKGTFCGKGGWPGKEEGGRRLAGWLAGWLLAVTQIFM